MLFVSETWEKQQQVGFDEVIDRMNEIDGISYISTGPRPNSKRGGGAAVLSNPIRVSVKRLEIVKPQCLEVLWASARPVNGGSGLGVREFILCSFYSPPQKRET